MTDIPKEFEGLGAVLYEAPTYKLGIILPCRVVTTTSMGAVSSAQSRGIQTDREGDSRFLLRYYPSQAEGQIILPAEMGGISSAVPWYYGLDQKLSVVAQRFNLQINPSSNGNFPYSIVTQDGDMGGKIFYADHKYAPFCPDALIVDVVPSVLPVETNNESSDQTEFLLEIARIFDLKVPDVRKIKK